jgi:acetoin utilization protein AcuB
MHSIRDIMHSPVVTVGAAESRGRAKQLMDGHGIGHLPVIDASGVVGVLSRRELGGRGDGAAKDAELGPETDDLAVERVMNRPVVTLDSNASIAWAAALVRSLGIGCIPVIDNRQLVGIVTRRDLRPLAEDEASIASRTTSG